MTERTSTTLEQDSDEDDDDEESAGGTSAKPSKALGAIAGKASEKPLEKKTPRMPSLAEFFKPKEKEPLKKDEPEEENEPDKAETSDEPELEEITVLVGESDMLDTIQEEAAESEPDDSQELWDEGDIAEEGEINLSRPVADEGRVESQTDDKEPEALVSTETEVAEETAEPLIAEFSEPEPDGGGSGELPPEGPETDSEEGDEPDLPRPVHTASGTTGGGGYHGSLTERFTGVPSARAAEDAMNEAIYRATKMGQNRGVIAGLLGGLYIGHRGKKKQAARFEKTISSKDSEIKQLQGNQQAFQERLGALENIKQPSIAEKPNALAGTASETLQPMVKASEVAARQPGELLMRIESIPGAPVSSRLEALSAAPLVIGAETLRRQHFVREKVRYTVDDRGNMDIRRSDGQSANQELPPEELPVTEDMYITPEGRRVELSSWHRIEIDQKTGKVINNPEVEYGEEFRHELQQETLRGQRGRGGAGASSAIQQGNMAASSQGSPGISAHHLPVIANPTLPAIDEPAQAAVKPDNDDEPVDPLVWVIVGVFVVILFLFAILR